MSSRAAPLASGTAAALLKQLIRSNKLQLRFGQCHVAERVLARCRSLQGLNQFRVTRAVAVGVLLSLLVFDLLQDNTRR
jgi:hypothetical protein